MEGQRSNAGDEGETVKVLVFPIVLYIWSGDLDNEKPCEKEDRRFRVVVLEKSTESIVDGEKDKHRLYRSSRTLNRNGHWSLG